MTPYDYGARATARAVQSVLEVQELADEMARIAPAAEAVFRRLVDGHVTETLAQVERSARL